MPYLLNFVYLLIIAAASPWLIWAAWRHGKYRAGFREKFLGLVPERRGDEPCVWIHAVSVGEVLLVAALVKELKQRRPDARIVLSATTKTGLELARKKYPELSTFYAPLDFSWAVRRAIRRLRPSLVVLAELELWPNLIRAAGEVGARTAVVNGRLGEKSHRGYRRIRPLVRRVLAKLDLVAAQNPDCGRRFLDLGAPAERVVVTGSLKYDGAETDRRNPKTVRLAELAGLTAGDVVWLAGSTQEGEEATALGIFGRLAAEFPRLRLILVPRHPERFDDVARQCERSGLRFARRSNLAARQETAGAGRRAGAPWQVLLVDAVGELGAWWGTADAAFVGGSFGDRGGQNMLEPAAYGAAVSFGPNTWNFREIVAQLLSAQGAEMVRDAERLEQFVRRCLTDQAFAARLGGNARRLVAENLGATKRTIDLLVPLLDGPLVVAPRAAHPARAA
jgi:3-deoxy-D-manno-octulosonic-acid transferase